MDLSIGSMYCTPQRYVPAAVFAQSPPSYSTACIAVDYVDERTGPESLAPLRALGAPYAFMVADDRVDQWVIGRNLSATRCIFSYPSDELDRRFEENAKVWSGADILRLKNIPVTTGPRQLDFIDFGLIPALEEHVRVKLAVILKETLSGGVRLYREHFGKEPDAPQLFRLAFSILAAKVLHDRGVGIFPSLEADNFEMILRYAREYYRPSGPILDYRPTQKAIVSGLWSGINFANLTIEILAHIWAHTFVTRHDRVEHGIYGTPYELARRAVYSLLDDSFSLDNRLILEPCCGHGIFLVAALQRLREFLDPLATPAERHAHFTSALAGFDRDPFAVEAARPCLSLADFPNRNHWNINQEDVFRSNRFEAAVSQSKVVLCNPPFRDFTSAESDSYGDVRSTKRPAELLRRVLERLPFDGLLGFVLPRRFTSGRGVYSEIRRDIATRFAEIEIMAFPDDVFEESEIETVLLLCKSPYPFQPTTSVRFIDISNQSWEQFLTERCYPEPVTEVKTIEEASRSFEVASPEKLEEVWDRLAGNQKVGDKFTVHRGIEWKPLPEPRIPGSDYNRRFHNRYTSAVRLEGYRPGVARASGMKAFQMPEIEYLSFRAEDQRPTCEGMFRYAWDQPKVAVSASRVSRTRWRLVACPDNDSLAFTQRLIVVWPKPPWTSNTLAAVFNGPVAGAYFSTNETNRDNLPSTLKNLPLPKLTAQEFRTIDVLVAEYTAALGLEQSKERDDTLSRLLLCIDAAVLKGYNLPPRLERSILDYFRGHKRPAVHPFDDYFPKQYKPYTPLWIYISEKYKNSTAADFLANIPKIDDPAMLEALDND